MSLQPYYQDSAVTIYHGSVVNCDAWTPTNASADPAPASAVSRFLSERPGHASALSSPMSTSRSGRDGARIIMRGKATA